MALALLMFLSVAFVPVTARADGASLADGTYSVDVSLEGGSGRATVESPCTLTVSGGSMTATITWSSSNYDLMIVDGQNLSPTNTEGNSTFEVPVASLDTALSVQAETTAMSKPHLIDYTLTFSNPQRQDSGPSVTNIALGASCAFLAVAAVIALARRRRHSKEAASASNGETHNE